MRRRWARVIGLAAALSVAGVVLLGATAAGHAQPPTARPDVTFARDVAPVIYAKCGVCHRPGGSGPFSLLTYADARQHARQIATVTQRGYMPPYLADAHVSGPFMNQPRLTDAELALLARWAEEGAPEGDARATPAPPHWTEGWQLGTPDVVVSTARYTVPAGGTDVFRIFVVRVPVDGPKFVRGIEFRPGNLRVVHHANIRIDRTPGSRQFDDDDPAPGYSGLIAPGATYPDGHFLGWTPGQVPPLLPKGMAWRLEPGTDLVVELHLQPSGRAEEVETSVGFYFGSDPPERTPAMLRLGQQGIDIPAGAAGHVITDRYTLPVDVEVQAVQPHAHYRAKEMWGTAELPDGTVRPLIHIADWDFRWQHVYRYEQPFALPKGTTLVMRYTYDNSAENPRNPIVPPTRVFWGQRSVDEMGDLWVQVLTKTPDDLDRLTSEFGRKVMTEDTIGYERWLQSEPESLALHNDVASLYLKLNRPADAARHFASVVARTPDDAAAHFNLGTALTVAGDYDRAVQEYGRALTLRPAYPQAHTNLGSILLARGDTATAAAHFAAAIQLDPTNAQASYNAGVAAGRLGRYTEAVTHLQRALSVEADYTVALVELAWVRAAAPDPRARDGAAAVAAATHADALTRHRDAAVLDVLAAAQAAHGQFAAAVASADEALALGPANVAAIRLRRSLYASGRPFVIPDSGPVR